jgi:hypothetical protein
MSAEPTKFESRLSSPSAQRMSSDPDLAFDLAFNVDCGPVLRCNMSVNLSMSYHAMSTNDWGTNHWG